MTQPPEPPPPPDDAWPTPDEPTVIASRETVVDGRPPEPVGPPPDRRIGAGMLLALGALALVALGILIAWYLTHRDDDKNTTTVVTTVQGGTTAAAQVAVPRLVGLKEQEALTRLAQLELRPKEVFKPTSKANGLVVSQKPQEATQVPKGSQVTLVVDKGAPNVAVPDLTGSSFSEAQAELDAAGLDSTTTEVTSDQPAGTVVDQAPKAGAKVAKGSTVTLSVARAAASTTTAPAATTTSGGATTGTTSTTTAPTTTARTTTAPAQPTSAKMPDVTGQTEQAAVTAMNRAGVLASLAFVPAEDPLGTVVQQAKPAGTTVPFHSHVQINVSKGPNAATDVTVPNTIGQTLRQAVSTLNGADLRLIFVRFPVTSASQTGKVVQQTPLSGGKAPQNAQVLVYLGVRQRQ